MKLRSVFAAVLGLGAGLSVSVHSALAVLPIEVYGRDPDIADVQLSADGSKLAMSRYDEGRSTLFVIDRNGSGKAKQYGFGENKIRDIRWSSDNHILVYLSKTTNILEYASTLTEFCGVFSIDTRTEKQPKQLMGQSEQLALQSSLCDVESILWNETGDVLMSARVDRGQAITGEEALFRVNGDTGRGKLLARGSELTRSWVTSPKGYTVARIDHAQKSNRYRVMVPTNEDRLGDWKTVFAEETDIPNLTVYGASLDEKALIIGTRQKSDRFALFEMSLTDGSITKPLFEPDGVDIRGVIIDPYTGDIIGASYAKDRSEQIFFQNDMQAVLTGVRGALKSWESVRIASWDKARKTFVIFAQGSRSAGDYFIFDRAKGKMEFLASMWGQVKPDDVAPVRAFTYQSRDGLKLQGFLTTPPGKEAKNLPLVVFPHGGPAARDEVRFDYWAQAMATRGYAVLQMNFRGSRGFGTQFEEAGYGEWGGKMQDDVSDAVEHVIKDGTADASRMCIVGASYGGYAALAGAAYTPDLYKCAVAVSGVSDLPMDLAYTLRRFGADGTTYAYWTKSMGKLGEDDAMLNARSPANAADKVKADVLLIHGKDDTVVKFAQSERMHDALKKAGKPVQLVTLDGEDHWMSKPKTRTEMLKAVDTFLAKHLGPNGGATGAGSAAAGAN